MKIKDMFSTFKNSFGETVGYIDIFEEIGEGWGQNGAKDFINQYRELEKTCSKIIININSPGGSVFTGQQIASYIKSSKIYTECHIGALCASIATVIACACDKVIMPSNSLWMSHSPISGQGGNAHDLRKMADLLDKIEETILNIYEDKCGGKRTREELRSITTGIDEDGQGTWLDAYECLEIGFIDEIGHCMVIAAQIDDLSNAVINGVKMDLSNFKNTTKLEKLIKNKSNDKLEETNMSNKEKQGVLDMINNVAKTLLGMKDEIQPEITNEQTEEVVETPKVAQEENLEVQPEQAEEIVAEETEAQEEIVEPSAEVTEEIEPSDEEITEPVATVEEEPSAEEVVEAPEEVSEVQEEQQEETEEQAEEITEEITDEIEPSEVVEPQAETVVPEVEASLDLVSELAKVKAELLAIKEADAQKAIALAKAELAKEVGSKFKGVPGKLEDKVELVYELKNSALSENSKEMIFKSLENLSIQNLEACQELGHSEEILVDETDKMSQAKALAQKEGISEGQAILVLDGTKTLKQVKNKK